MLGHLEVVAAIIERDGLILCAQRKAGDELSKKWEFPGGKIETGETHHQALAREIDEELGISIQVGPFFMTVEHLYANFSITMHCYLATILDGQPVVREHLAIQWLRHAELRKLDWAPADQPIAEKLIELPPGFNQYQTNFPRLV